MPPANPRLVLALHRPLFGKAVTMAFRRIPAGRFRMGSRGCWDDREESSHEVIISEDFWMAQTPVTQAQFARWRQDRQNHFKGNPDHPAEKVDWNDAAAFCQWLNQRHL